jgi:hypothetical protein
LKKFNPLGNMAFRKSDKPARLIVCDTARKGLGKSR